MQSAASEKRRAWAKGPPSLSSDFELPVSWHVTHGPTTKYRGSVNKTSLSLDGIVKNPK